MISRAELLRRIGSSRYLDVHSHCADFPPDQEDELLGSLSSYKILTFSAGTDWGSMKRNRELAARSEWIIPCTGVHPWQAGNREADPKKILEEYARAVMVSEIGLDSVWAGKQAPLKKQIPLLKQQLSYAAEGHKPVTLHTKGAEGEVLALIQDYPGPILIHWYNGPEELVPAYLEKGCFLTIPPAVVADPGYRRFILKIPASRLLPETDNPTAWPWLFGTSGKASRIKEIYESYASLVGKNVMIVHNQFQDNLIKFFQL